MGIEWLRAAPNFVSRHYGDLAPAAAPVINRPVLPSLAIPSATARTTAVRALLSSPTWGAATVDQRRTLLTLLDRVGPHRVDLWSRSQGTSPYSNGYDALIRLFSLRAGATPVLLLVDREGRTIADRLAALVIDPRVLAAAAPLRAEDLMANLLLEIADPSRIDQGFVSTCAPTTLQYHLAVNDPAEYIRLCSGMLSSAASVRMRGGELLSRDDNSLAASDMRSPTERMFQNALIQASLPAKLDYVSDAYGEGIRADTNMFDTLPGWLKALCVILFPVGIALACVPVRRRFEIGMTDAGVLNAATQIFGRAYAARALDTTATQLDWLRERAPDGNFAGLGYFVGVMPFGMGGHELMVERIDYTSSPPAIIARNPWGSAPMPAGLPLAPDLPDIIVENSVSGTIRMPITTKRQFVIHHPL